MIAPRALAWQKQKTLASASNIDQANLGLLRVRTIFPSELEGHGAKMAPSCLKFWRKLWLKVACNKPRQIINGIEVVGNQLPILQLDPIVLFQKSNQFHYGRGVDDSPFDERVVISEPFAGLCRT